MGLKPRTDRLSRRLIAEEAAASEARRNMARKWPFDAVVDLGGEDDSGA